MKYTRLAIVLLLPLPLSWSTASAQAVPAPAPTAGLADLSLEQLMEIRIEKVFSASKFEQKVTQAPASVTIITADEIEKYGHRSLADVLRSVRGLYVADDGNYSYLGARGFLRAGDYNTRTLVLIDGHRMNDTVYDSAYFGQDSAIDIDLIERVEFIRGPSSSIYGSNAFFGVLNIVTKQVAQLPGTEISSEAGSFGTYKGRITHGQRLADGVELVLSASYYRSEGRPAIYYPEFDQRISPNPLARDDGRALDSDAETALNLSGSLKLHDFTVSGSFNSRRKVIPTASFGTLFNDGGEFTVDRRGYVDVRYEHEWSPELRLAARATYDRYNYYGDYPYDLAAPGAPSEIVINKDDVLSEWVGAEMQLTAKIAGRHTVMVGGEFRQNLHQRQINYDDTAPRTYTVNDDHQTSVAGLYAQGEFSLQPGLLLNAGLRYDYYREGFGGTLNPRLGLIYSPGERTTLKALYGQAFRAPNAYELYYYQGIQPQLKPETIHTLELVLEHYFTRDYLLQVSSYRYQVRGLISQVDDLAGNIYFANRDRTNAQGIEVELSAKHPSGGQARVSYALQRTEDDITGAELSNSPRHLAKLNLLWPLAKERLTAGLELQYDGTVRTLAGATAGDFLLTNLTFTSRGIVPGLELSLSAYNLFDTRYAYPGAIDHIQDVLFQPGRSVRLKATYRF